MNGDNKSTMEPSAAERSPLWTGLSYRECEQGSYLRMLVAELLYRNQVLRFDLMEARDRVERSDEPAGEQSQKATQWKSGRQLSRPRKGDLP
jgi:hypothetical protein